MHDQATYVEPTEEEIKALQDRVQANIAAAEAEIAEEASEAEKAINGARDFLDALKAAPTDEEFEGEKKAPAEIDPLIQIANQAIYALNEIVTYGDYGRARQCAAEAREALDNILALKKKYDEQTELMDILKNGTLNHDD